MKIRKIVFVVDDADARWDYSCWSSLDAVLSDLVDRLHAPGYEHTLELEFQLEYKFTFTEIDPGDDPDTFFPCFREKGRVTILEKTNERIIYCSDG